MTVLLWELVFQLVLEGVLMDEMTTNSGENNAYCGSRGICGDFKGLREMGKM
ncbi:hypothetical protein Syun_028985 [Stephania yunnanensis]|uniref:Uncharacterized protein n=1 Tax=Stephania yunnanensis TaxID=152371 RepID=A0AAP0E4P5_9MAGN